MGDTLSERTSINRPKLHALNGIRVIAEFAVVRGHTLQDRRIERISTGDEELDSHRRGPYGMDIMCFFFVLSGFVIMYTHQDTDFSHWKSKIAFIRRRLLLVYPVFLFCWSCGIPGLLYEWATGEKDCWARRLCTFLQLGMMDVWFACGSMKPVFGVTWFLSCLMWLWLAFPFCKDRIRDSMLAYNGHIWTKLLLMNLAWAGAFYLLWGYAIYTLAGFPLLRLGEFLIGCGAACALGDEHKIPFFLANGRYWYPALMFILMYNFERQDHGMEWLCLHEESSQRGCALWGYGQPWVKATPPCFSWLGKIGNKSALPWVWLIYGLARAELAVETGWYMRVLQSDVFKFLSGFSMTLYVAHIEVHTALKWLAQTLLGWEHSDWNDDTLLIGVYLGCYGLHCAIVSGMTWLIGGNQQEQDEQESKQLLVEDMSDDRGEEEQGQP